MEVLHSGNNIGVQSHNSIFPILSADANAVLATEKEQSLICNYKLQCLQTSAIHNLDGRSMWQHMLLFQCSTLSMFYHLPLTLSGFHLANSNNISPFIFNGRETYCAAVTGQYMDTLFFSPVPHTYCCINRCGCHCASIR